VSGATRPADTKASSSGAIEAVDRVMRGEGAPSPAYEGEDGFIAWLLGGPSAEYTVPLPEKDEPKRAVLDTYTKEHSAEYQSQALIDLARRLAAGEEPAFETFFAERRPFFLEGSGMFNFDLDCNDGSCSGLFYSRRIGRQPRGAPALVDGAYAAVPQQTTILGAAKLNGRVGKFSFGLLDAVTADEQATIANGTLRTRESVEPLTNYTVLRTRREFTNQSSLGFMLTSTRRRLEGVTAFLPEAATTGGVDWDWRLGFRRGRSQHCKRQ
jgi:hypothetical protein